MQTLDFLGFCNNVLKMRFLNTCTNRWFIIYRFSQCGSPTTGRPIFDICFRRRYFGGRWQPRDLFSHQSWFSKVVVCSATEGRQRSRSLGGSQSRLSVSSRIYRFCYRWEFLLFSVIHTLLKNRSQKSHFKN